MRASLILDAEIDLLRLSFEHESETMTCSRRELVDREDMEEVGDDENDEILMRASWGCLR